MGFTRRDLFRRAAVGLVAGTTPRLPAAPIATASIRPATLSTAAPILLTGQGYRITGNRDGAAALASLLVLLGRLGLLGSNDAPGDDGAEGDAEGVSLGGE